MSLPLLILLCQLTLSSKTPKIVHFEAVEDYFVAKETNSVVVVFFHDSSETKWRGDQLTDIINKLFKLSNVSVVNPLFGLVDLSKLPFFRDHYDLTHSDNMQLLISNNLIVKENYHLIWDRQTESTIKFEILGFLTQHFNRFSHPVDKDLQSVVEQCQSENCAIYMGDNNQNLSVFKEASLRFVNINFLTSDDLQVKYALTQFFNIDFPNNDCVLFIRKDLSTGALDPKTELFMKEPFEIEDLSHFIEFANQPKLRLESAFEDIIHNLMTKEHILLIHCRRINSEDNTNPFVEALKYLPRGLMYFETDSSKETYSGLSNLLFHARSFLRENHFYIVYNDVGSIKAETFELMSSPTVQIVEQTVDFLSRKRRLLPYFKFKNSNQNATWNKENKKWFETSKEGSFEEEIGSNAEMGEL